ncbi:MAG: sigma-54-dependent Fis family transcriptional regulator [candidate division Zixibacteria bacterium]|nr:sigma-54-dependent Fis family transcriptional regulator [candidate division Zixibacteria bacterium]
MPRVLVIDDEDAIRSSLKSALDKRGHETVTAANARQGLEFSTAGFDVIFLDIMLPDRSGLDILPELLVRAPQSAVVMISGHADIDTAVKAIRLGAYDFIEKPLSLDRVLVTVDNACTTTRLKTENVRLSQIVYPEIIGQSAAIRKVKDEVLRAAGKASRFLILGENGTGKELVAHMIHRHGKHPGNPFVPVNCAALPSELVESELFGHAVGAFTGATKSRKGKFLEANGGTIFLDEISEMPLEAQAKILRAIESHEITPVGADTPVNVQCTIVAASNRDLPALATEGRFRQDLYYRLNVVTLHLPALRERREDIPLLCDHFLRRFAIETGSSPKRMSGEALAFLDRLLFPGNIRELKNLMERANIYCESADMSEPDIRRLLPHESLDQPVPLREAVDQFESDLIKKAIDRAGGNMTEAARQLGIERSHLYKKLKKSEE